MSRGQQTQVNQSRNIQKSGMFTNNRMIALSGSRETLKAVNRSDDENSFSLWKKEDTDKPKSSAFRRRVSPHPSKIKRDSLAVSNNKGIFQEELSGKLKKEADSDEESSKKSKDNKSSRKEALKPKVQIESEKTSQSEEEKTGKVSGKDSLKERSRSIHLGKRKSSGNANIDMITDALNYENKKLRRRDDTKSSPPSRKDTQLQASSSSAQANPRRGLKMIIGPNRKKVRVKEDAEEGSTTSKVFTPVRRRSPSPVLYQPKPSRKSGLSRLTRHATPPRRVKVAASPIVARMPAKPRIRKPITAIPLTGPIFLDVQRLEAHIASGEAESSETEKVEWKSRAQQLGKLYQESVTVLKGEAKIQTWGQAFARVKQVLESSHLFPDWDSVESIQGDEEDFWHPHPFDDSEEDIRVYPRARQAHLEKETRWQKKISTEQEFLLENFATLANLENDRPLFRVQRQTHTMEIHMKPLRGGRGGAFDESEDFGFADVQQMTVVIPTSAVFHANDVGPLYVKFAANRKRKNDHYKDTLVQHISPYVQHLPCFVCRKVVGFSNLQQYFTHIIKNHHQIESGFKCVLCNKDFYYWLSFEKHFDLKHNYN